MNTQNSHSGRPALEATRTPQFYRSSSYLLFTNTFFSPSAVDGSWMRLLGEAMLKVSPVNPNLCTSAKDSLEFRFIAVNWQEQVTSQNNQPEFSSALQVTQACFGSIPDLLQQAPWVMLSSYPKLWNSSEPVLEQNWLLNRSWKWSSLLFPFEKQVHSKRQSLQAQEARVSTLHHQHSLTHAIWGLPVAGAAAFFIWMCTLWI